MVSISSLQSAFQNVSAKEAIQHYAEVKKHRGAQLGLGVMGSRMVKASERAGFIFSGQELNPQDVIDARKDFIKWDGNAVKYRAYPGLDNARDYLREEIEPIYPKTHDYSKHLFVIEALPEDFDLKIKIMRPIIEKLPKDAVIAINTSSLSIEKIAEQFPDRKEQFVGIHFFKPADRNDIVEIVRTKYTSHKALIFAYNYIKGMGKTPVVSNVRGFANEIIGGVMNEQSKIVAEGKASRQVVDEVFMEVLYRDQYQVQLPKVQQTFKENIPKLGWFEDEKGKYAELRKIDNQIQEIIGKRKSVKYPEKLDGLIARKKELLEAIVENLGQKILYLKVGKNIGDPEIGSGSLYTPPEQDNEILKMAKDQFIKVKTYLDSIKKDEDYQNPLIMSAYKTPNITYSRFNPFKPKGFNDREYIAKRLMGAYIGVAQRIVKEGLASVHDVEVASKGAFRYNVGPNELGRELVRKYGEDYVKELISYANPEGKLTGIIKPEEFSLPDDEELSGIQVYVQDDVAHIVMGRYHVQNGNITMNSLHPDMIRAMLKAIKDFNANPNVNGIIIESQGSNEGKGVFSSGADLNYINKNGWNKKLMAEYVNLGQELMTTIAKNEKPISAIADGTAAGGGFELLAAIADNGHVLTTTRFSGATPECGLGIYPAWFGTYYLSKLWGKEAALPFIANSKGLTPGGWVWVDDAVGMKLGLGDNGERITTDEVPEVMARLVSGEYAGKVNGEERLINIRQKSNRKPQFNKPLTDEDGNANFPAEAVRKFRMKEDRDGNVVYKRRWRLLTRFAAMVAEIKVMYADDPQKEKEALRQLVDRGKIGRLLFGSLTDEQIEKKITNIIVNRGWLVSNLYIKPVEKYFRSKTALTTVKALGVTLKGTLWTAKNIVLQPASWVIKKALKLGVGLPLRITYDTWHYLTKPVTYGLGKDKAENLEQSTIKKDEG